MASLKLAKLPDRTPVKLTLSLSPELRAALDEYAALYEKTYGHAETLSDLATAILDRFLAADRAFQKARSGLRSN